VGGKLRHELLNVIMADIYSTSVSQCQPVHMANNISRNPNLFQARCPLGDVGNVRREMGAVSG
jgi:hypothetical protein